MGALGWDLKQNDLDLDGDGIPEAISFVGNVRVDMYQSDDHDWHLFVVPLPGVEGLPSVARLTNSVGDTDSEMTCEVKVIPDFDSKTCEERFFGPLVGRRVTVQGTWVEDRSHPWLADVEEYGVRAAPGFDEEGLRSASPQVEIHPISSVLAEMSLPGDAVREFVFMVFSDDTNRNCSGVNCASLLSQSGGVWFSGQSRVGTFDIPFGPPPGTGFTPRFELIGEVERSDSPTVMIVQRGADWFLAGRVASGRPDENKGLFRGRVRMWWEQVGLRDPSGGPLKFPAKNWVPTESGAAIQYEVKAEVFPQSPGIHFDWTLVRGELPSPTDPRASGESVAFRDIALARSSDGRLNYRPKLVAFSEASGAIERTLWLREPMVTLAHLATEATWVSQRGPHGSMTEAQPVFKVKLYAGADHFASPDLRYTWEARGVQPWFLPPRGGPELEFNLDVRTHAPQALQVTVAVADPFAIETASATLDVEWPEPTAMIVANVRPVDSGRYEVAASVSTALTYAPVTVRWVAWSIRPRQDKHGMFMGKAIAEGTGESFTFQFDGQPFGAPWLSVDVVDAVGQQATDGVAVDALLAQLEANEADLERRLHDTRAVLNGERMRAVPDAARVLEEAVRVLELDRRGLRLSGAGRTVASPEMVKQRAKELSSALARWAEESRGRVHGSGLKSFALVYGGRKKEEGKRDI